DGIRFFHVTGVKTCALPILPPVRADRHLPHARQPAHRIPGTDHAPGAPDVRAEERRVTQLIRRQFCRPASVASPAAGRQSPDRPPSPGTPLAPAAPAAPPYLHRYPAGSP